MTNKKDDLFKNYLSSRDTLNIYQLAIVIERSPQTITNWYKWKKLNPDNELSKFLPEYIQNGERQERFWHGKDVGKLIQFRDSIPTGSNGIMGEVTQKYIKKEG